MDDLILDFKGFFFVLRGCQTVLNEWMWKEDVEAHQIMQAGFFLYISPHSCLIRALSNDAR